MVHPNPISQPIPFQTLLLSPKIHLFLFLFLFIQHQTQLCTSFSLIHCIPFLPSLLSPSSRSAFMSVSCVGEREKGGRQTERERERVRGWGEMRVHTACKLRFLTLALLFDLSIQLSGTPNKSPHHTATAPILSLCSAPSCHRHN